MTEGTDFTDRLAAEAERLAAEAATAGDDVVAAQWRAERAPRDGDTRRGVWCHHQTPLTTLALLVHGPRNPPHTRAPERTNPAVRR